MNNEHIRQRQSSTAYFALGREDHEGIRFIAGKSKKIPRRRQHEETLDAWHRKFVFPWAACFDLSIVLLYVFFAMTYEATKMDSFHNFQQIFDRYYMEEQDEDQDYVALLYFPSDVTDAFKSSLEKSFVFPNVYPTQDILTLNDTISINFKFINGTDVTLRCTQDNIEDMTKILEDNLRAISSVQFDVVYILERDDSSPIELIYRMTFKEVEHMGFFEWRSVFAGTNSKSIRDDLSIATIPLALIFVDGIALVLTTQRLISEVKYAIEYARKNYVSVYRAFLWKTDQWEIVTFVCQILTFISVFLFLRIANSDFSEHSSLLLFLGFTAFTHSIALFRYLKLKDELWLVARLLYMSLGKALGFVIGFLPIFFGYVFLGISVFGHYSDLFKGFLRTLKILTSLMHTDVCQDTQNALNEEAVVPNWVVLFFVNTWLVLNGGIILNVLITVVENVLSSLVDEYGTF